MTYFVLFPDGRRFGPADKVTLQQWINEGRLHPYYLLEDAVTGGRIEARLLPGLSFRGTGPLRPNEPTHDGSGEIGAAFLFTALGFVCCPAVSLVGIVFAIKARERNHRLSDTALAVSILGFAGAMVFQSWLYRKVMGG